MNRREYLISASAFSVAAIAGCSGSDDDDEESDSDNGSASNVTDEEPDEPQNETESDPEDTQDDTEFIEGSPSEILPGEDFDPYGWVHTGDSADRSAIDDEGEYMERSYVYENHTLSFEVWVFDSVEDSETYFESHLDHMPDTRELEPEDIGDEGYRYRSGANFIIFREANVIARVRSDRGFSVIRENAEIMREQW